VVVAVGVLADERCEQAAGTGLSAVDDHRACHDDTVDVTLDPATDDVGDHLERQRDHRPTLGWRYG
jgi:hypothetical protein